MRRRELYPDRKVREREREIGWKVNGREGRRCILRESKRVRRQELCPD